MRSNLQRVCAELFHFISPHMQQGIPQILWYEYPLLFLPEIIQMWWLATSSHPASA